MDDNIVKSIIKNLFLSYNCKNNNFFDIWRDYSKLTYNNIIYTGDDIKKFFLNLNCTININHFDHHLIGDRRSNVLVSGHLIEHNKSINMFILLALDNNKEYWIHSTIIQIF